MSVKSSVLWLLSLFENSIHRKPQAFGMGLLGLALSMGLVQSAQADNRLGGISTRSFVQTESANYMIAGVFINGGSKRVVVRASSVDGVLNPRLEVQSYPDGNLLYSNDNWSTDPSAAELQQTGWAPNGTSDAAMIITLSPGLYTMQVSPVDKPGVGLIEVYELNSTESPKLGGISTRSFVQTNSMNYMIAGLFISGSAKRVVVRASSVDGVLDPRLEVQSYPDGNLLYSNDNWDTDPSAAELQQTGWAPARSLDAAMIITLSSGLYTMQVSPKSSPGIGLIEVYELPEEPDGPKYSSTPASGGTLSFSTPVGTPVTQNLTITEDGDANLEIKLASITGIHANDFSILTAFPFTIADGGAAKTVTIQCTPSGEGVRTANLQISSNDGTHSYPLQCTATQNSPVRYTDNGDGTVTDNRSGLIWLKNASCFYLEWREAKQSAANLASG
ncbi:choice-of-anchor D domain-containing protein [Candidatus Marithioploca araucensis]|uniref:Choice-of-anchor D domain-containing protein n=1 Tax=Candidatus Marithioploca araucensis TaxID=70273 RepID=A0ABT7VTA0_9GAMM|nr:choice-of-anchor D domain-containing protein [Candidatus Marithioploca araucensis]